MKAWRIFVTVAVAFVSAFLFVSGILFFIANYPTGYIAGSICVMFSVGLAQCWIVECYKAKEKGEF